ncbi:HAD hydrolase-like protein [Devosia sp. CN2-171]|uniref:HAD hydrolase-like protein n=1 Tax=Devosia sp. CN2-171 TaxID=3400909 RepID=UPI003BF8A6AD
MSYRLVIFDFDGTLADSIGWMAELLNAMASRHGYRQVGPEELEELRSLGNREIMSRLGVQPWRLPFIAADARKRSAEAADRIRLFDGAPALLAELADSRVEVAIVSSNSEATIRRILGPTNAGRVGHYRCGASLFGKARKFKQLVTSLRLESRSVLCVGDETRDIDAARAAGLPAAAVTWGSARAEILRAHKPDFVADSFAELSAIIRQGQCRPQKG